MAPGNDIGHKGLHWLGSCVTSEFLIRLENYTAHRKGVLIGILKEVNMMRLLLLIPINLPDAITLLIGGVVAFALAFVLTFFVKAFCYKVGWLDRPASRRVHTKAVPRLGGVAIYLAFVIASLFFYTPVHL